MVEREGIEKEGRGRSAKKREAKAVEDLAHALVELPESRLTQLPLAPELRAELELARSTRNHGARKRQTKHLAALLRRSEDQQRELQAYLAGLHSDQLQEQQTFHHLEELRERLCAVPTFAAALQEARSAFPDLDVAGISRLARSVHASGDKRAFREIFRALRQAAERRSAEA